MRPTSNGKVNCIVNLKLTLVENKRMARGYFVAAGRDLGLPGEYCYRVFWASVLT